MCGHTARPESPRNSTDLLKAERTSGYLLLERALHPSYKQSTSTPSWSPPDKDTISTRRYHASSLSGRFHITSHEINHQTASKQGLSEGQNPRSTTVQSSLNSFLKKELPAHCLLYNPSTRSTNHLCSVTHK